MCDFQLPQDCSMELVPFTFMTVLKFFEKFHMCFCINVGYQYVEEEMK